MPLVGARALGAAATVGLAVFVARVWGVEFSGSFYFLQSSIAVVGLLTRVGAEQYLTAQVTPEVRSGARGTIPTLVATLAAVGLLVCGAGLMLVVGNALLPQLVGKVLGDLESPILLGLAVFGFNSIWTVSAYCRAIGWATRSILLESGLLSLWLGATLLFWVPGGHDPALWIVALAIFAIAPTLVLPIIIVFRRQLRGRVKLRDVRLAGRGLFRFGSVTLTNSIIVWVPVQVLGYFGKIADVGVYNAAFRVTMLVGAFGVMVKSVAIAARIVGDTHTASVDDRKLVIKRSALITAPFLLISLVVAWQGELLAGAFGVGFDRVKVILPVMLVAQSVNVGGYLIETTLVLRRDTRSLNLNALSTLVVAAIAAPLFIAHQGLTGAAWSFAITTVVSRLHLTAMYLARDPRKYAITLTGQGPSEHDPLREKRTSI